jgi:hypothetical protein
MKKVTDIFHGFFVVENMVKYTEEYYKRKQIFFQTYV